MTVEANQTTEIVAKEAEMESVRDETKSKLVTKSSSYREESNFLSDLKEHERKALNELKSKLEEAILGNTLFVSKDSPKKSKSSDGNEEERKKGDGDAKSGKLEVKHEVNEEKKDGGDIEEELVDEKNTLEDDGDKESGEQEVKHEVNEEKKNGNDDTEEKRAGNDKTEGGEEEKKVLDDVDIDKDVSIWGVPLLPSKGDEGTNVVLLKFLRAREFRVNGAFEMIKKALIWRKEFKIDSILDEDLGVDLYSVGYMNGKDRKGRPICYNIFGPLDDEELYNRTFGMEEKHSQFIQWRVQLMEKGIQKLDFKPGGVNSLVQINDLKNSPGPSRKEVRVAANRVIGILQDTYPEFVSKNIFINVPFWYYAYHSLLSAFLSQRTNSKLVFSRPAKVTETLLKYIPIQEIPIQYGGLKRETDFEFSDSDCDPTELLIKAGSTDTIEIAAPESGTTFIWDVLVLGWEVNYKEEFIPNDENSYTIIVQKEKKVASNDEPVRNTFKNNEQGKIVLTINNSSRKKKKAFYRYKIKKPAL